MKDVSNIDVNVLFTSRVLNALKKLSNMQCVWRMYKF